MTIIALHSSNVQLTRLIELHLLNRHYLSHIMILIPPSLEKWVQALHFKAHQGQMSPNPAGPNILYPDRMGKRHLPTPGQMFLEFLTMSILNTA
jgi:hypothetical protein